MIFSRFLIFSKKTGFDISSKLSPKETICMKCLVLFSGENKKKKIFMMSSAALINNIVIINNIVMCICKNYFFAWVCKTCHDFMNEIFLCLCNILFSWYASNTPSEISTTKCGEIEENVLICDKVSNEIVKNRNIYKSKFGCVTKRICLKLSWYSLGIFPFFVMLSSVDCVEKHWRCTAAHLYQPTVVLYLNVYQEITYHTDSSNKNRYHHENIPI